LLFRVLLISFNRYYTETVYYLTQFYIYLRPANHAD